MKGNSEFDDSQAGPEMPRVIADNVDDELTEFGAYLNKIGGIKFPQIFGQYNFGKQAFTGVHEG
jgi:hypothetical protein